MCPETTRSLHLPRRSGVAATVRPRRAVGALLVRCWSSVARLLRATAVRRPAAVGGTTAAGQLAVGLGRRETAALRALLELHLGGRLDRREEPADRAAGAADLVHLLRDRGAAVGQLAVAVLVDRAEGLVDLDELAVRQPADDTGLDAVLEHLAVVLLQA